MRHREEKLQLNDRPNQSVDSSASVQALYQRQFSMDHRKRGFHARGVYPTQDISRMKTVKVKQEEETDTKVIRNMEESNVGTIR